VGVSLISEQVAALIHNIVWLKSSEVNGEQVQVPVLYLVHSNDCRAPNGAQRRRPARQQQPVG